MRNAIAERRQIQIFHHKVGGTAICRNVSRALDRLDLWIRQLRFTAAVDTKVQGVRRNLGAVGPDPPDTRYLPLAEGDGQADAIAETGHLGLARCALAAALRCRAFGKLGCPDDLAGNAHTSIDARHGIAFAGTGQAKSLDAASFHGIGTRPDDALINHPPKGRTCKTTGDGSRHPQKRAANRAADGRTCGRK